MQVGRTTGAGGRLLRRSVGAVAVAVLAVVVGLLPHGTVQAHSARHAAVRMHPALGRFTGMVATRNAVRPFNAAVVAVRLHARYEARLRRWDRHLAQVRRERALAAAKVRARAAATRRAARANTLDGYTIVGHLTVMATAYWPDPAWSNGYTATGVRAGYGVVAVDPNVIPLGTHLYIPGYGQAIAADTGGAIIGDHIDLCYPTGWQAQEWGVQYVTITIER